MQTTTQKTNEAKQAYTYFGDAEYFGHTHLYDGNDSPKWEGTVEEVISYLEQQRCKAQNRSGGSSKWKGQNGSWYEGEEAVEAIDSEIANLRDGSHFSMRGQ